MLYGSTILRWPGAILSNNIFLVNTPFGDKKSSFRALSGLRICIAIGIIGAGIAMLTGDAEDLLFILYFETFPEHYHDDYSPFKLLARIPTLGHWLLYTGGSLSLVIPFSFGPPTPERQSLGSPIFS